jgi:hypothetical protein
MLFSVPFNTTQTLTFEGTKAAGITVTATEVRTVSISVAP